MNNFSFRCLFVSLSSNLFQRHELLPPTNTFSALIANVRERRSLWQQRLQNVPGIKKMQQRMWSEVASRQNSASEFLVTLPIETPSVPDVCTWLIYFQLMTSKSNGRACDLVFKDDCRRSHEMKTKRFQSIHTTFRAHGSTTSRCCFWVRVSFYILLSTYSDLCSSRV